MTTTQRIFNFPNSIPSWYIGHMSKGIKEMKRRLREIDLMIEIRDSRLPLSSINPMFENLLLNSSNQPSPPSHSVLHHQQQQHHHSNLIPRLIIYNKKDLADSRLEKPLIEAFKQTDQEVLFTNSRVDEDVKSVLKKSLNLLKSKSSKHSSISSFDPNHIKLKNQIKSHPSNSLQNGYKIMICGMPNVGKSSLLNSLRRVGSQKGKVVSEAPMPGHTRSVGGFIKILEASKSTNGKSIYIFDTPGIMPLFLGRGEVAARRAFKIALTAGIKDSLFDSFDLSSYLLHLLIIRYSTSPHNNLNQIYQTLSITDPTFSIDLEPISLNPKLDLPIEDFLKSIAHRIKAFQSGGMPNLEVASEYFLKSFRDGKFGEWTLDELGQTTDDVNHSPLRIEPDHSIQTEENALGLNRFDSVVIQNVLNGLKSSSVQPQSPTALKMAERRKGKAIQRARSLSNLQKRRSR
ncbi:P-loop containing nucleoside triphosphate hydrolase protein [Melampsora americana]|nr:P-loop containing nucleoside triphosphate hydrolase protein [Melampsora americana]